MKYCVYKNWFLCIIYLYFIAKTSLKGAVGLVTWALPGFFAGGKKRGAELRALKA